MARISVTSNAKDVNRRLERRVKKANRDIEKLVKLGTGLVRNTAVNNIQGGVKSGKIYKRGTKTHQASAPGEYPASDTGDLAASISQSYIRRGHQHIGKTTASMEYGKHLEYGTMNMQSRPFMFPSLEKNRRKILQRFKNAGFMRRLS
jgi:HK97 gp10 family phage protein